MENSAPLLKPLNKTKLHEEIVDQLKNKIISREISPGGKLPAERNLAVMLDVNRSTVREALHKLESMDLVEIRHGEGVYVKDYLDSGSLDLVRGMLFKDGALNLKIFKNLLDLRRLLVPEIAYCAALNRNKEDLEKLEQTVFNGDGLSISERDLRLHNIIARASGNVLFVVLLNAFTKQADEYYDLYFSDKDNKSVARTFHKEIYQAIKRQDAVNAKKIMFKALSSAEDKVLQMLDGNI